MTYHKACRVVAHKRPDALPPIVITFLPGIAAVQMYGPHAAVAMRDAGILVSLTPGFRCILKALQAGHLNFYLALIGIVL
ncbi:MAG: hypothetical protein ACRESO_01480, partial [Gammaproteobacteria bacterium]